MSFKGLMIRAGLATDGKDLDVISGILTYQANPVGRLLGVQTANSSPVTNTIVTTAFDKTVTIPSGILKVGDTIRIRENGIATNTNAADTLIIALTFTDTSFGGFTTIQQTIPVNVSDSDIWAFDSMLTVDSLGGGFVAFRGNTIYQDPDAPGTALKMGRVAGLSAGLNSFAFKIGATAQWNNADAGNSCKQESLTVEVYENR